MIDSLVQLLPDARQCAKNGFPDRYALVTLHRPSNVDNDDVLRNIVEALLDINGKLPIVFPVHPRTRQRIADFGIDASALHLTEPIPYIECLSLQTRATVVITDSGGIQEETTFLNVPCLTLRDNTERPITVELGTNILVGHDNRNLRREMAKILDGDVKMGTVPPLWDGRSAERIADVLKCQNGEVQSAVHVPI
jgi:UDP-N-acetylglucosamine 2-epimerase (non-hydrolysing)